ncbi:hypothetical protein AQUCO_04200077v1 [Aquilegia coerulea]|uniref:Uncharacterized protein n=1 Tax=Aquilegia coerulea TaxID=218851 RepID=A0A2G5CP36_AQUCA|nr:hypothetical protein AQUCO_04200077v1 [Aquilegia coerulea]
MPKKIITMSTNQCYWTSVNDDVKSHIEQALLGRQPAACVLKPLRDLAFAAPKSAASVLCVAACEMVGGHREQAIAAASAIHLMHSAAFTHENLLVSDKPITKSMPNVHHYHAFDSNIELLTADNLFLLGYELLAELDDPTDALSERILKVIVEISTAMGSQGMVEGQYIQQLSCMGSDGDEKCKVSYIFACGAVCGAILGGGTNEEIEKLRRYGFYVGMMNGMMTMHGVGLLEEKTLLQMVESFRNLALKELENFQDRNIDTIRSLTDGFHPNE